MGLYGRQGDRTWKLRNQIFESTIENVRIWSIKGFARLAPGGTPNIFDTLSGNYSLVHNSEVSVTYMCKDLFRESTPFCLVEGLIKAQ